MVLKRTLKTVCEYHLEDADLLPHDDISYCNIFVQRVCHDMGYDKFNGMLANQIHEYCLNSSEWVQTDTEGAFDAINRKRLVLAALTDLPHGHVALGWESHIQVFSGKWNGYTIQVASVGQKNGVFGANWVFQKPPDLFILKE